MPPKHRFCFALLFVRFYDFQKVVESANGETRRKVAFVSPGRLPETFTQYTRPGTAMAMNYGGNVRITFHVVDKVPNFNFYPVPPNSLRGLEVVQYSMAF